MTTREASYIRQSNKQVGIKKELKLLNLSNPDLAQGGVS